MNIETLISLSLMACVYISSILLVNIILFVISKHSSRLSDVVHELGFNYKVRVINSEYCTAFVFGLIPTIFTTSELVRKLSVNELKSILAHEIYHLRSKLFLKVFLIIFSILIVIRTLSPIKNILIPVIAGCFGLILNLVIMPFIMRFEETKADIFAAKLVGKELMIKTLRKIAEIEYIPTRWESMFLKIIEPHPEIEKRIENILKYA